MREVGVFVGVFVTVGVAPPGSVLVGRGVGLGEANPVTVGVGVLVFVGVAPVVGEIEPVGVLVFVGVAPVVGEIAPVGVFVGRGGSTARVGTT